MDLFLNIILSSLVFFVHNGQAGFTTKIGPVPIWNATYTDKLRHDLLLNYDKFARPAQHFNTTTVRFGLTIKHIDLNEFKSTLTMHAWIRLSWTDEKLKWNSTNYGGLSTLNFAEHEIWQPDIFLYNSASSTINHYGNTHCLVYESGEVIWVPPTTFTVFCNLNLKYWPFDTQNCELILGSWTYNGEQIDIEINDEQADLDLLVTSSEWEIVKTNLKRNMKYYPCCPEPYVDATLKLILSRVSPSYKALIITPAIVIMLMILLSFWLPPQAGEKIILNGCTAIIISLFMLYFTQKIPAMGTHTPLVVFFYSSCLYIIGFSLINSVVVITISRNKHNSPIPWIIKQPLTGSVGKFLGLGLYINQASISSQRVTIEEMRDHQVTDFEDHNSGEDHEIIRSSISGKAPIQQDWILLAAAIDRIAFCFFFLLFTILSLVYSI